MSIVTVKLPDSLAIASGYIKKAKEQNADIAVLPGHVDEVREQFPLIKQRRTDIYRLEKVEK